MFVQINQIYMKCLITTLMPCSMIDCNFYQVNDPSVFLELSHDPIDVPLISGKLAQIAIGDGHGDVHINLEASKEIFFHCKFIFGSFQATK